jgi:hypothetical protein
VAAQRIPADDGDVLQHPGSVTEVADAGALVVGPAYRDFDDAVAALEGYEKNLRIKAPPLDGLELEDGLRGGTGKGLESALRVGVRQTHDGMGDHIETAAKELAVKRLANGLARALKPARADGDVCAAGDGGKKPVGFLDWSREIGIGKHDHLAERVENAVAHAVTFAAIAGILKHPDFWGIGSEGTNDISSVVVGSVVDDDNFGVPATLADAGDDGLKRATDAGGFVICRYDDAVLRVGHLAVVRVEGPTFNVSYAGEPSGYPGRLTGLGRTVCRVIGWNSEGGMGRFGDAGGG